MKSLRALDRGIRRWIQTFVYELRRTRRVIVPETRRAACPAPIFILGVHRSGTTLLRLILDSHPNIACPPESFFIAPLQGVTTDEKAMEGLTAMGFDETHVRQRLRETAAYFFEMYAASRGKTRWADKTPSYVDCMDFLESLFGPDSQYVLIFRHGLDVACSISSMEIREVAPYIAECHGNHHAGAARYWATQCAKLRKFQARHPGRCFEIRYENLVRDPERILRQMFRFLGEEWDPAVIDFNRQPHDHWIGLQDGKAAESTRFEPRFDAWKKLPREVIDSMVRESRTMLSDLGYTVDP